MLRSLLAVRCPLTAPLGSFALSVSVCWLCACPAVLWGAPGGSDPLDRRTRGIGVPVTRESFMPLL